MNKVIKSFSTNINKVEVWADYYTYDEYAIILRFYMRFNIDDGVNDNGRWYDSDWFSGSIDEVLMINEFINQTVNDIKNGVYDHLIK